MRILVTGDKGFIGFHLIRKLSKGHYVVGFDIKDGPEKDVRKLDNLLNSSKNVDVIVHLAALCIHPESVEKPLEYLTTNILGTINVLEVARRLKIKKIINMSSAGFGLTSPYAISKLFGEQLCELYSKLYGINIVTLRIFNAYGEGNDKGVINKFFSAIKSNKPVTIHGDGEYVRDYVYVKDIVNIIKKIIEKNLGSGTYEVGTGIGTDVNELIKIMERVTGKKMEVKHEPLSYDIIKFSVAKKSVVKNPIKLEVGLKELWKSFIKGDIDK